MIKIDTGKKRDDDKGNEKEQRIENPGFFNLKERKGESPGFLT